MLLQLSQIKKFVNLLVITNFLVLVGWQTALFANESYYKVVDVPNWDVLNIRKYPNHRSKKVGQIPPNERCVLVIGEEYAGNDALWFQVSYDGTTGWVNSFYMLPFSHCN